MSRRGSESSGFRRRIDAPRSGEAPACSTTSLTSTITTCTSTRRSWPSGGIRSTPMIRPPTRSSMRRIRPEFSQLGLGGQFVSGMAPDFRIPYTIQFTGGLTHEFPARLYVQADYVGSRGKDAVLSRNVNVQLVDGRFVTIDPRFSGFSLFQNLGFINYNALQTRAEYRGARLRAGGSYTLAK